MLGAAVDGATYWDIPYGVTDTLGMFWESPDVTVTVLPPRVAVALPQCFIRFITRACLLNVLADLGRRCWKHTTAGGGCPHPN